MGLWLASGEQGYEQQAQWGLPLPADFSVVVLPRDTFLDACNQLTDCDRGVLGVTDLSTSTVLLRDDLEEFTGNVLLHEMGHVLRGRGGHINDKGQSPDSGDGQHVMCAYGFEVGQVTARDHNFVQN